MQKPTLTPSDLRAAAEEASGRAERLRADAQAAEREALALREAADKIDGLTSDAHSTTILPVSAISSEGLARGMARSKSKKHPFVRVLYERGMTVTQWAEQHGYKMGTVASWVAKGAGGRRIPEAAAKTIEREMGEDDQGRPRVPASLATWKNGIVTE